MKFDLSERELQNLMGVLDAGVKALGVPAVLPLAPIMEKIGSAIEAAKSEAE